MQAIDLNEQKMDDGSKTYNLSRPTKNDHITILRGQIKKMCKVLIWMNKNWMMAREHVLITNNLSHPTNTDFITMLQGQIKLWGFLSSQIPHRYIRCNQEVKVNFQMCPLRTSRVAPPNQFVRLDRIQPGSPELSVFGVGGTRRLNEVCRGAGRLLH